MWILGGKWTGVKGPLEAKTKVVDLGIGCIMLSRFEELIKNGRWLSPSRVIGPSIIYVAKSTNHRSRFGFDLYFLSIDRLIIISNEHPGACVPFVYRSGRWLKWFT